MNRNGRFVFVDGLTGLFVNSGMKKDRVLRSSKVVDIRKEIETALGDLRTSKTVLIIDQLDVLLAASEEDITSTTLSNMLLSLREVIPLHNPLHFYNKLTKQRVHSTLLTLSSDTPLLQFQHTTLEREHASLTLGQAHGADKLLALRMLDTGTARDVSGVVRVTGNEVEGGKEFLYYVAADGSVRVFERGT